MNFVPLMVGYGPLASTAVMGAVMLAVGIWLFRVREWRRVGRVERRPAAAGAPALPGERAASDASDDERAWLAAFALLTVAVAGGAVLAVQGSVGAGAIVSGMILMVSAYLVVGVFVFARSHGHVTARATGEALAATGMLLVLGMVVNLVLQGLS